MVELSTRRAARGAETALAGAGSARAARDAMPRRRREDVYDERPPRIVLAETDPYLGFLIRLDLPEAQMMEAQERDDLERLLDGEPDLVVVNLQSPAASRILAAVARAGHPKILGVVEGTRASRTAVPPDVDALLVRPFMPAELHRAVRAALRLPAGPAPARPTTHRAIETWTGPARLAAVAFAAVLQVSSARVSTTRAAILAVAFVYAILRMLPRRTERLGALADVAVAAALVAATGGPASDYIPLGVVAAAETGIAFGVGGGTLAGIAVAAASTRAIIAGLSHHTTRPAEVAAWLMLFALAGAAGGLAARIWLADRREPSMVTDANRVLSRLYRITRAMQGGLEIGAVASAIMDEARAALHAPAGALLLCEVGSESVAGAFGLPDASGLGVGGCASAISATLESGARVVPQDALPPEAAAALATHACWIGAPLRRGNVVQGALLVACPGHEQHDRIRPFLRRLADEAAVAVENAQLFQRIRELSVDEERHRLARELHDGVAQALAHLRLELEFLARHRVDSPETLRGEAERLTRVAARALTDVRTTILGLRASASADGLGGALRSYLRDLHGLGGPEIDLETRGSARLRPDVEAEIFRIAQEAISNALRHARASRLRVQLDAGEERLRLVIEDDGVGVRGRLTENGGSGLGISAMRERAERIHGRIAVTDTPSGGTTVELECPVNGWRRI